LNEAALLVATTNLGKKREIEDVLLHLPQKVLSLEDLKITASFPETGATFLENAKGKSLFYSRYWEGLTLAEDSGLEIAHLDGAPGIFSARFSGPQATDKDNNDKVLRLLSGVPFEKRKARFVSFMVLSEKQTVIEQISGEVEGYVSFEEKGTFGFGYDPLFFYPPLTKTFAELLPEEKNRVSHRGQALVKLRAFLKEYLGAKP
jgi:XTP/dITP diphosphohydrolase